MPFERRNYSGLQNFLLLMENTMRFLSFFALAVLATASLAVSGCGGTTDAPSTGGGTTTTAPSEGGSQSSKAPAAEGLTTVSFDVTGMT